MHCLVVMVRVRDGCEAAAADHLRQLAEATRQEPGNVLYLVHRAAGDPGQFFIYEQYRTAADHAAHRETGHYRRHAAEGFLPLAESRTATVYELL
jgi:quinol monooxygenase YgiN